MSTLPHPGRRAMLRRACHADIDSEERARLIGLAVPRLDPEHVLQILRDAQEAHEDAHSIEAEQLFARLVDEDQNTTQGGADG